MTPTSSGGVSAATSRRNIVLLAFCQALAMSGSAIVLTVTALTGRMLTPVPELATLPVTLQFVATTATTVPAALLMARVGRRLGFSFGQACGVLAGALATYAILEGQFWTFTMASALIGVHNAFWQQYRFAAADTAADEGERGRAISYVMIGGVLAAAGGPQLAKWTVDLFAPVMFAGAYTSLACLSLLAIVILQAVRIPRPSLPADRKAGRPIQEIARQPVFVVAVISSMVAYAVMNLIMTSTPLAMEVCGFIFSETATIIQWHVLAMFAPSFFTGHLIRRFGTVQIILCGALLMAGCIAAALAGIAYTNFWVALVLVGLGWNFMFVGGSTLLTESYRTEERAKCQGTHDFLVFGLVAVSAFSSGAIHESLGWAAINAVAMVPVALAFVVAAWFLAVGKRRSTTQ